MDRDESEVARDALLEDNDDDLEFHITFPSPCATSNSSQSEEQAAAEAACGGGGDTPGALASEFVFVSREDPEPVVFLLGWAGCSDKHLAKYSKIYEDCGCITIRYTAPAEYIFFDVEKIRPLSKKLLDLIAEMSLEANPVLFHVFSNNGSTVYQYMSESLRLAEYADILPKVRGGVFDSAPGRRTNGSFLRAAAQVVHGQPQQQRDQDQGGTWLTSLFRALLPYALIMLAYIWGLFRTLVGLVSGGLSSSSPFCYDFVKENDGLRMPLLFLYSVADDIIGSADVEEVADAKKKQGCDVTKVCYDDSLHCQHLRKHRESYVSSVCSFLNKCLKDKE